jgi:hypothetical protein
MWLLFYMGFILYFLQAFHVYTLKNRLKNKGESYKMSHCFTTFLWLKSKWLNCMGIDAMSCAFSWINHPEKKGHQATII